MLLLMRIKHEFVRQMRLARGSTQQEVADEIEVDVRTYRKYENGEVNGGAAEPLRASQYETLRGMAALFGLPGPEDLIDSRGTPEQGALAAGARSPVPWSATSRYVHREKEERKALNRLRHAGTPVVLQGPEHHGVSTLLGYLLDQANQPDEVPSQVLRIDLSRLEKSCFETFDSLLRTLGQRMLDLLAVDAADELLTSVWGRPGSEKSKISFLLEEHVLPRHQRVLLALQHGDRLLDTSYQDDFFGLLRAWAESGGDPPWSRLRLLVTVSTEPTLLESIDHSSFFALASPIRLSDLSPAQLLQMAELHGQRPGKTVMARFATLTGGHPYLARLALVEAQEQELSLEQFLAEVDPKNGVFALHLHSLRRWLEQNRPLFDGVCAVLADPAARLPFETYCRLYSKGLLVEQEPGVCRMRCPLYEDYFGTLCRKG